MNRTLIINADDLGYTEGINRTVLHCFTEGSLSSSTLMANGAAFEEAVRTFKAAGLRSVGLHLVLTELKPVSPPEQIPDLVDAAGFLPATPFALLGGLARGTISKRSVLKEVQAQIAKLLDFGLAPTHIDSHKHVHILPKVLEAALEAARRNGVGWIRNPFDGTSGWRLFSAVKPGERAVFCKQHFKAGLMRAYRAFFLKSVRTCGMRTPDHFFGVSLTGIWSEAAMERTLRRLPPGLSEWMVHPGTWDRELQSQRTRLLAQRETERDLLLSPLLKDLLEEEKITLKPYGEEPL